MSVHIELESQALQPFLPSQDVRGRVVYSSGGKHKQLDTVDITFQGIINIYGVPIGRDVPANNEEILFRENIPLYRSHGTLQDDEMFWPFTFIIPEVTTQNQRLPPSFKFVSQNSFKNSGASVNYTLEVSINKEKLLSSHKKTEQGITILPTPTFSNSTPSLVRKSFGHQEWQNRALQHESHTLKQKLQHVYKHDPALETPAISFTAFLTLPQTLAPGQIAPIAFGLEHEKTHPTDPENPTLVLKEMALTLQSATTIQGSTLGVTGHMVIDGEGTMTGRTRRVPDLSMALPLDGTDVEVLHDLRVEDFGRFGVDVFADFETANGLPGIWHQNQLGVEAVVLHEESGHTFRLQNMFGLKILTN